MAKDSIEAPLPQDPKRDKGYNKANEQKDKPATGGFSQFWSDLAMETKRSEERIEKILHFFSPVLELTKPTFSKITPIFVQNKRLFWPLFLLLIMVLLPWISEASVSTQTAAELKAFAEPMDPIKTGQLAMNLNQYLPPQLYADPDQVVLDQMTKNDTYTLAQQLNINAGSDAGAPERQAPTYTVQSGETITQIATRFDLHVGTILQANGLSATDLKSIKPGTVLKIPSSDTDTSNNWLVAINQAESDAKAKTAADAAAVAAAAKKKTTALAKAAGQTVNRVVAAGGRSYSFLTVIGTSYEQCLPWAREQTGIQIHGYAGDVQPTQSAPRVGGIALDRFFGHASVVVGIDGDSIIVHEANFVRGKITERRVSQAAIRGYVY